MHAQRRTQSLPPQPIKAWARIVEEKLDRDFAIVQSSANVISIAHLRNAFKFRDACRWVLFVHGPKRDERIVARSAIQMPDEDGGGDLEQRLVAIDQLPIDSGSFLRGIQMPAVAAADDQGWWNEPPRTTVDMQTYTRAATAFLHDLRSERPLGVINRCGLWITLRAVAAIGDETLLGDLLDRFHAALLYDLRQGAHRFSPRLAASLAAIPAVPPGTIACIGLDQPVVTRALRSMFPTDSDFGALPFESIDLVAPLVASRSILIQAGWLMAPLRLLRPYVLAGRTMQTLRHTCKGWLAAATATADQAKLRALGLEMKQLFRAFVSDLRLKANNVMCTSTAAAAAAATTKLKPPRCAREYLMRAERGDIETKLVYHARWGVLRLLRGLGSSRFEVERAFLSTKGMPVWYPDPRQREVEAKHRRITLINVFRKPLGDRHVSCQTLTRYGVCPFQGNVGACCAEQTGSAAGSAGVWSPMQVARLGRPLVEVAVEPSFTQNMLDSLYVVPDLPERLHHASVKTL